MRYPVISLVLAAALSAVACSDQTTEVAQDSVTATLNPAPSAPACSVTANDIKGQIDALFPAGALRTSAQSQFKSIPPKTTKPTGTATRDKTFNLIAFVLKNYYAGKLIGAGVPARVLTLISALNCYAGLPALTLPPDALDPSGDGAAAIIMPNSPTTTVLNGTKHAGFTVPTGAVSQPVVVTISRLPDSPGPLLTSLNQYPLFYEFTVSPNVTFNLDVLGGICLRDNVANASALRLAHNVGTTFGAVEVLPFANPGFLDCTDLGVIGARGSNGWGHFAWARSLLLPEELHAATAALITPGVGGTTRKFSPFGAVDPGSNPGSFTPVGTTITSEPVGTTVTRTVHVASQNGTAIARVPVIFATTTGTLAGAQPVLTDDFGNASVSWTLPADPDVFSLTATVPAIDNPPPSGSLPFAPDVAFDGSPIPFTVAGASNGQLTALPCDLEGSIRSLTSGQAVTMHFSNQTDQNVSVYWLDFAGDRSPYNTLEPASAYDQPTYVTHPWVLIGAGETCYGIFLPLAPLEGTEGGTATAGTPVILLR